MSSLPLASPRGLQLTSLDRAPISVSAKGSKITPPCPLPGTISPWPQPASQPILCLAQSSNTYLPLRALKTVGRKQSKKGRVKALVGEALGLWAPKVPRR